MTSLGRQGKVKSEHVVSPLWQEMEIVMAWLQSQGFAGSTPSK